ncbi:MAG: hypothetical protein ACR2IK_18595, partial [Chloroflexota bacterium]
MATVRAWCAQRRGGRSSLMSSGSALKNPREKRAAAEPGVEDRDSAAERGSCPADDQHHVTRRLDRLSREERRLLDAYQADVISLDELSERRVHLEQLRRALIVQQEQAEQLRRERFRAQEVLASLTAFCERIGAHLDQATFEERQVLLNLVVERIIVGEDTLEIRHVI